MHHHSTSKLLYICSQYMQAFFIMILPLLINTLKTDNQQRYSDLATVANPNAYTQFFYYDDLTYALLYGPSSQTASLFTGYSWKILTNSTYSAFTTPPSYAVYFYSQDDKQHNYAYGDQEGEIMRKFIVINGSVNIKYWTIDDEQKNINRISLSKDQNMVAVTCENSENVYIVDFGIIGRPKKILNYTGVVTSTAFRNTANQLVIAGGDLDQRYFILYDYVKDEQVDNMTSLTDGLVLDFAFSEDGMIMYYVEEASSSGDYKIKVFDFKSLQSSTLTAADAQQFVGVSVRGQFVSAWDGDQVYIWNRATSQFYGQYESKLTTNGLSPDGSNIVTLSPDLSHVKVLQLCQNSTLYDPSTDSCLDCNENCHNCFIKQNQCSDCQATSYLTEEYTCRKCETSILGCVSCVSVTECTSCNTDKHWVLDNELKVCKCAMGYFFFNDECVQCMDHCWQCDATDTCQVCDLFQHWVMKNDQCVCLDTYYQSNNQCLACYEGCYACQSGKTCEQCYTSRDWEMRDGKCQCKVDYVPVYSVCFSCWNLISNCQSCSSSTTCTQCQEGYQLDGSNYCVEKESSHVVIFVVVGAAVVVLAIGGFFLWRYLKNKRQGRSLLEQEASEI